MRIVIMLLGHVGRQIIGDAGEFEQPSQRRPGSGRFQDDFTVMLGSGERNG